jgi:hypothetical protein
MNAEEIAAALYRRHPAVTRSGSQPLLGAWTVLREWNDIDILAISCYLHPAAGAQRKAEYPRIGYEIKISRSDYRRELLDPGKRQLAIRLLCHEFYFAVPADLLSKEELAYVEPAWDYAHDFTRQRCAGGCYPARHVISDYKAKGLRANSYVTRSDHLSEYELCGVCGGRGYAQRSRVEREAPTLWVPADVGLIVVGKGGARCLRKSPVSTPPPLTNQQTGDLARWVSVRPDPRHAGIAQAQRRAQRDEAQHLRQIYKT